MFGLSSLATTAIGAAVIAVIAFAGGARMEYKIESGKINALQLQYAQAEIKQQQKYDTTALNAAKAENLAQTQLTSQGNLALPEVNTHVITKVITSVCVPWYSPPENQMQPARLLSGMLWVDPLSPTITSPEPTPSN